MTEKKLTARVKNLIWTAAVLIGLALVVGATSNLPATAQGFVTGENEILIDQLTERVGAQALTQAVVDAGVIEIEQPSRRSNRRGGQTSDNPTAASPSERNRRGDRRGDRQNNRRLAEELDDQLERLAPDVVYQIAVDAGLITQADANAMLAQ